MYNIETAVSFDCQLVFLNKKFKTRRHLLSIDIRPILVHLLLIIVPLLPNSNV